MKSTMQIMFDATPKRSLGWTKTETDHGLLELILIPTSRGSSMFYRRDWYLNRKKVSAKYLSGLKNNSNNPITQV